MIPSPGRKNIRKFWSLDRLKSSDLLFLKHKRGAIFVLGIQLFQLRLSDHFKLTQQDLRVVWVVQICTVLVSRLSAVGQELQIS